MKRFSSLLCLLALAGCSLINSPPADAGTLVVTWTNPTTNTDSSAIAQTGPTSLQSWRIEYGTCSAPNVFGTKAGEFIRTRTAGEITTATNNVPKGMTCVRVTVTNQDGGESDPSNVSARDVPPIKPNPPTNVVAS